MITQFLFQAQAPGSFVSSFLLSRVAYTPTAIFPLLDPSFYTPGLPSFLFLFRGLIEFLAMRPQSLELPILFLWFPPDLSFFHPSLFGSLFFPATLAPAPGSSSVLFPLISPFLRDPQTVLFLKA